VLEDPGIPARGFDDPRFALMVEALHPNTARPRHDCGEPGQAEATFVEFHGFALMERKARVDDHVKRDGGSFPLAQDLGGSLLGVLGLIFDNSQLTRHADLGRGQPDARGVIHGFAHPLDQLLCFAIANFIAFEFASLLAKYRFAHLHDFQFHELGVVCNCIRRTLVDSTMATARETPSTVSETEPRWPAALATLATAGLYFSLPERLTLGPSWLIAVLILVALLIAMISHRAGQHQLNRTAGLILLVLITGALVYGLGALIAGLPDKREKPIELLRSAAALWISNILVFASWYWRLDAGGPHSRDLRKSHEEGAFLFPQMTVPGGKGGRGWKPGFVDYLFLAFNSSTAFSPTDVPVLSRWAKVLMMVQSLISLGTIAILGARAINIL
jgi:Protein of unknown function (DUF1345)